MAGRTRRTSSRKRVRYGVIGQGYISQVAVLPAFAHARRNSELAALFSDDEEKLRKLGRKYGVDQLFGYDDFERGLEAAEIDAVYIALPNDMHREYTERAAGAGVHVLCEKPMAVTAADCEAMIQSTQAAGVRLMIAYRLHFQRANLKAVELVKSGRLGQPRFFSSDFSMQVKDKDNIRLQRERGGGPLYDIGIYCINAARYLFRSEPIEVACFTASRPQKRFEEVEEMASCILRVSEERLASFTCSFGASDVSSYRVIGTLGSLRVDHAYEYSEEITHQLTIDGKTRERAFAKRDQFGPELVHFSQCVIEDRKPEPSGVEGLADVRIIEALYKSAAKDGKAVRVDAEAPGRRPSLATEIRRPAVKRPALVHATSPGGDEE